MMHCVALVLKLFAPPPIFCPRFLDLFFRVGGGGKEAQTGWDEGLGMGRYCGTMAPTLELMGAPMWKTQ